MVALLAALVLRADPYPGFRVRYIPFSSEMLLTFDAPALEESGYDLTSLLYPVRERIAATLRRAGKDGVTAPAKFDASDVRLSIHLNKETWLVDRNGTVLHGKEAKALATYHFTELREMVATRVPNVQEEIDAVIRLRRQSG